ncbi:MAG: hypothetical protein FJ118_07550 [Deltaproteobacteria bacterium]|nr:hypothetical protein [Deltaproteobacteria bacterium]
MSQALAREEETQELRVLDADLPFLAVEAAIDIDNLLSNSGKDLKAMRKLADRLTKSVDKPNGTPRSLMDPATLTVLGEALAQAGTTETLEKVDDLLLRAEKISQVLSSEDPTKNLTELKEARAFCLALSREAAAYRNSLSDLRPSHPFRR